LTESVVLGLAASIAGLGLGTVLAAVVNAGNVSLTPATIASSLATGTLVTVAAALLPAMAASRTTPVAALTTPHEGRARGRKTRVIVAALLGAIGLALTAKGIPTGKTGLLLIAAGGTIFFLGFMVIGPLVAGPLAAGLGWLPSRLFGVRMRLATTGARRNPSRTATTTVALTIGIGLMTLFSIVLSTAGQFAAHEMNRHFPADYMLSVKQGGIPDSVVTALRASPRIAVAVGIRAVLERTTESALLRALGLTRQGLRTMISGEAMLLGLLGAVAGVAFGIGFGWATCRAFLEANGGPVSFPVLQITGYIAVAAVAALLASVIPARRAARLTVIDGLAADLPHPSSRARGAVEAALPGRAGALEGRAAKARQAPLISLMTCLDCGSRSLK
jgi:predicted lysophospholipase L1 biosynthesis ABC-type transport system permease subunit